MDNSDRDGNDSGNWQLWRFVDGALAISVSMLLAALLRDCLSCGGWPVLGYLHGLAARDDGVIIVGTMLLFPTTATIYGGIKVFFAAREAVRREAREKGRQEGIREGLQEGRQEGIREGLQEGRQEGIREGLQEGRQEGIREGLQEGRQEERERIRKELAKQGVTISPELAKILDSDNK